MEIFPSVETVLVRAGRIAHGVPFFSHFYNRFVDTRCDKLRAKGTHIREIQFGDFKVIFDVTDFTMRGKFFYGVSFEPETTQLILNTLRPGDVVLDIGANKGYISCLAAARVGETGRIFAFEPNPALYECLQEHLQLNGIETIVNPSRVALSNSVSSETVFYVSTDASNSGLSSLTPVPELLANKRLTRERTIHVQSNTLDRWLSEQGIETPIDLIKVDVEGAEVMVLEGARNTLTNAPPKRWIIETQTDGAVVDLMKQYRYKIEILDDAGDHANILFTHPNYLQSS